MSSKLSDNTLEQTQAYWRERTGREVTAEDAREMVQNIADFFEVLQEWDEGVSQIKGAAVAERSRQTPPRRTASR